MRNHAIKKRLLIKVLLVRGRESYHQLSNQLFRLCTLTKRFIQFSEHNFVSPFPFGLIKALVSLFNKCIG